MKRSPYPIQSCVHQVDGMDDSCAVVRVEAPPGTAVYVAKEKDWRKPLARGILLASLVLWVILRIIAGLSAVAG